MKLPHGAGVRKDSREGVRNGRTGRVASSQRGRRCFKFSWLVGYEDEPGSDKGRTLSMPEKSRRLSVAQVVDRESGLRYSERRTGEP